MISVGIMAGKINSGSPSPLSWSAGANSGVGNYKIIPTLANDFIFMDGDDQADCVVTEDTGASFTDVTGFAQGSGTAIHDVIPNSNDAEVIFSLRNAYLARTSDLGDNWDLDGNGGWEPITGADTAGIKGARNSSDRVGIITFAGGVQSNDGTANWVAMNSDAVDIFNASDVVDALNNNSSEWMFVYPDGVTVSIDNLANFTTADLSAVLTINCSATDKAGTYVLGGSAVVTDKAVISRNNGTSFTNIPLGFGLGRNEDITSIATDENEVWLFGLDGGYCVASYDDCVTFVEQPRWLNSGSSFPTDDVAALSFADGNFIAGFLSGAVAVAPTI